MHVHANIALGCSHTLNIKLLHGDRWPAIVFKRTSKEFYNYGINSAGLSYLMYLIRTLVSGRLLHCSTVVRIILQKPTPIRTMWWKNDPVMDYSLAGSEQLESKTKFGDGHFQRLNHQKRVELAEQIYNHELSLLQELRDTFPNAAMVYYRNWIDDMHDLVRRPELADINHKLGIKAEEMGYENWGTIIDPKNISGVYDEEGELILDNDEIAKNDWFISSKDNHPGIAFQQALAKRVINWVLQKKVYEC